MYQDLSQHFVVPQNNSDIVWVDKTFVLELAQKFVGDGIFTCLDYVLKDEDLFLCEYHVLLAYGGVHMRDHVDTFNCAVAFFVLYLFLDKLEAW